MIKCCVILEEYVGIYLFKDQYVVATESFDYGPDVLNIIFNYLKQYNVSVLNVVMSSYLTGEVYREVVIANEYDIEGKHLYEYVPEIDIDKIRHLATVAKVPEINFYGSVSCNISKISMLAVAAMIVISIISGVAFGISRKLGDVNYRIKQNIAKDESALAEVKAESEKLSVLNYDSTIISDLLSIKVNGCVGYVSMNSEEIEILYYLRDEKSAKTLEDKLTNYKVASIEKSGILKVEDTECLKYTVKIERSTL